MKLEVEGGEELDILIGTWAQGSAKGVLAEEVAKRAAPAITVLVDANFAAGRSPLGDVWAPLSCRSGTPLHITGALQESARPMADGNTLEIVSDLIYSGVQQKGKTIRPVRAKALRFTCHGSIVFAQKVKIPARPFVPPASKIPPSWDAAVEKIATEILTEFLGAGDKRQFV